MTLKKPEVAFDSISQALVESRAMMLESFGINSCILAAKITTEVLKYFGVKHTVTAAECFIANRAAWDFMHEHDRLPMVGDGDEYWTIAIDETKHVVVVTDTHLIDLSADQFHRPHRDIYMEPMVVPGQVSHKEFSVWVDDDHGTRACYKTVPGNKWWTDSPNWGQRDEGLRKPIIAWTIRRAKEIEKEGK